MGKLVEMEKDGEHLQVHPTCVEAHKAVGWKESPVSAKAVKAEESEKSEEEKVEETDESKKGKGK